jgi:predicted enzyme related to lactoylglutathione lyase
MAHPVVYFEFPAEIKKNGGENVTEKTSMGEWGSYAVFRDPERNIMGLHEFSEEKNAKKK